jgi:hypothetical protein
MLQIIFSLCCTWSLLLCVCERVKLLEQARGSHAYCCVCVGESFLPQAHVLAKLGRPMLGAVGDFFIFFSSVFRAGTGQVVLRCLSSVPVREGRGIHASSRHRPMDRTFGRQPDPLFIYILGV